MYNFPVFIYIYWHYIGKIYENRMSIDKFKHPKKSYEITGITVDC